QLVSARQYSTWTLLRRWLARHRARVAATFAFVVILVAVGAWSIRRVVVERNRAEARSRQLTLTQARTSLERDPTAALAWLKTYPKDAPDWDMVRDITADAVSRGIARHILRGHTFGIVDASFSPDGRFLATGAFDRVHLWEVATGRENRLLKTS